MYVCVPIDRLTYGLQKEGPDDGLADGLLTLSKRSFGTTGKKEEEESERKKMSSTSESVDREESKRRVENVDKQTK